MNEMLLENHKLAFISQMGNFDTDFTNKEATHFHLTTALIVKPEEVEQLVEFTRNELNETGREDKRRLELLEKVTDLSFSVVYLVIDKQKIYPEPDLNWQETLIKHTNKRLYQALLTDFQSLRIIAPKETLDFMQGFASYVDQQMGSLFNHHHFDFSEIDEDKLLQLTKFIAQAIFLDYEKNPSTMPKKHVQALASKIKHFQQFPGEHQNYLAELDFGQTKLDTKIAQFSIPIAIRYIEENETSDDPLEKIRVLVLRRLLSLARLDPLEYISTPELIRIINTNTGHKFTEQDFRSHVTAKLRDRDVLIASSDKGYKLPLTVDEVILHCNRVIQMVNPMLTRLQRFRENILVATKNELDILEQPEYRNIRIYFTLLGELERGDGE